MNDSENIIEVKILDRSYKVKCPNEQAKELRESAEYVDQQMRRIRSVDRVTSADRVAVVTALNICHELLLLKAQQKQYIDSMHERIQNLQQRIEGFLVKEEVPA